MIAYRFSSCSSRSLATVFTKLSASLVGVAGLVTLTSTSLLPRPGDSSAVSSAVA